MKKTLLFISVLVLSISTLFAQKASDYRADAEKGNAVAQLWLGFCYYNSYNDTKDYEDLEKAAYWYQKSAEQGNADAQCWLGFCYYMGYGVERDLKKAKYWSQKAADQGQSGAKDILKLLESLGY
jgi:TPR repeat protein